MSSPAVEIIDDLWVCQDCILFIANGDLPDEFSCDDAEQIGAAVVAGVEREAAEGWQWCSDGPHEDEDEDADVCEFSWGACECCRSRLGGSRHRVALVRHGGPPQPSSEEHENDE